MKTLLSKILTQIVPTQEELAAEKEVVAELLTKIRTLKGKHIHAAVYGSVARQTQLRNDKDIDFFVLFSPDTPRKEFEREGLRIAKTVLKGHKFIEAYSEHPYIKGRYKGFDVEIIPAYKVTHTRHRQSAVDRTPFHHAYMQRKLKPAQKNQVRLFKQFLKGINAYGADMKNESLSGYATELLILHYGTFPKTINALAKWKPTIVIPASKKNKSAIQAALTAQFPRDALILIDPTDETRNVTSAASKRQLERIISAARAFHKKPGEAFFFPKPRPPLSALDIQKKMKRRAIIGIQTAYPRNALPETYWGQLKKLAKKTSSELERLGFRVKRSESWSDEKKHAAILFELKELNLGKKQLRTGPPATDAANVKRFLAAHKNEILRKFISNEHLVIEIPRKTTSSKDALQAMLTNTPKTEKKPLQTGLRNTRKVLDSGHATALAQSSADFRLFVTQFMRNKEFWE